MAVVATILIALFVLGGLIGAVNSSIAEFRYNKMVSATRRTEAIDGNEATVVTRPFTLVRHRKSHKLGLLLNRGFENDPTTIRGKFEMRPRWVQILPINGLRSLVTRSAWQRFSGFDVVATIQVDEITQSRGWFRKERFLRYSPDFLDQFQDRGRKKKRPSV